MPFCRYRRFQFSKRVPNNLQNIFRSRAPPLVLLNSLDDTIPPPDMKNLYATPNSRKRRSNAYGRTVDNNMNNNVPSNTVQRDPSTLSQNQLLQHN